MLQIELLEWQEAFLGGVSLTARDKRLAQSLDGVELRELSNGIYIRATSWVGVVRFESFSVTIRPKLSNADIARMLLIAGGLDRLRRILATRTYLISDELSLFDLIALLFAEACAAVERLGLLRGYIVEEDDLPVLRGRLRFADQVRRRYGQVDRLECRFDEHDTDITENQILATALDWCRRGTRNPLVRRRIQQLSGIFEAACRPLARNWRDVRAELTYNRLNTHYQEAHTLAWIVLEGLGVRDLVASGNVNGFAFLLDMNALFEEFVVVFVRAALQDLPVTVHSQARSGGHIWDIGRDQSYAPIIPDMLLQSHTGNLVAVDAKYKRYDDRKLAQSDIYQVFLYSQAFDTVGSMPPAALLIYPTEGGKRDTQLHIRDRAGHSRARLLAHGIDIPRALDSVDGGDPLEIQLLKTQLRNAIGLNEVVATEQ